MVFNRLLNTLISAFSCLESGSMTSYSCGTGLEKVTTLKVLNQNKPMIFSVGTEELWVN